MKEKRGKLIVFEGVDAAGKTTLCDELYQFFLRENKPVRLCHFPGKRKGTLGELVYRIHHLHSSEFNLPQINPCSLQILHIAAHVDAIESVIKPALSIGEIVILDRFWWSTYVYGIANGVQESQLRDMINIEKSAWGAIQPDVLFWVDSIIPLRDDEKNSLAWQNIRQEYNRLAEREGAFQNCVHLKTGTENTNKHRVMSKILESVDF